jgi:hypothetical protein
MVTRSHLPAMTGSGHITVTVNGHDKKAKRRQRITDQVGELSSLVRGLDISNDMKAKAEKVPF